MKIDLDKLKKLAAAATPGVWKSDGMYIGTKESDSQTIAYVSDHRNRKSRSLEDQRNDASFIAAANPSTVLALIERLERAERALNRIALNISGDLPAQVIAGDAAAGREPGT